MELLSNIEKHSGAEEVTVLIRNPLASDKIHSGLLIFISDDGRGIDAKILETMNSKKVTSIKNLHFGLQNIKLRLNEIAVFFTMIISSIQSIASVVLQVLCLPAFLLPVMKIFQSFV